MTKLDKMLMTMDEVFRAEEAQKMTIHYENGASYHVKNPEDIILGYDVGGKLVLVYSQDYVESANLHFGFGQFDGVVTFCVTTGDIASVALDFGLSDTDRGIRRTLFLEV